MSDFITRYPYQFDEREKPYFEQHDAACEAVNQRGPIDVDALISGTLPEGTPGVGPVIHLTDELVAYFNSKYNPFDPLYNDLSHAKAAGFDSIPAIMTIAAYDDAYIMAVPHEARDVMLVAGLNHSVTSHRPIYAGDTLHLVVNHRHWKDITPETGSDYRTIAMTFDGEIFNQNGELVNSVVFRVRENLKTYRPECRPAEFAPWEGPAWGRREDHTYTDEDWQKIIDIWAAEEIRGATPRYFEDVQIGDEPAWTLDGPIDDTVEPIPFWGCGLGGTRTLKSEISDPATRATMKRNPYDGIYRLEKRSMSYPLWPDSVRLVDKTFQPHTPLDCTSFAENDDPMCQPPERAMLINYVSRDFAIRHFTNWMGDAGYLKTISWGIMPNETMHHYGYDLPPQEDAVDFLEMFPDKHGKCLHHPMERDVLIVKSRVYDKHIVDGEHLVEFGWWVEDILGNMMEEGRATVRLPSREA